MAHKVPVGDQCNIFFKYWKSFPQNVEDALCEIPYGATGPTGPAGPAGSGVYLTAETSDIVEGNNTTEARYVNASGWYEASNQYSPLVLVETVTNSTYTPNSLDYNIFDLTINGSTTTNSSTNTTIADNIIELNSGISSSGNDIGFIFERGSTGANACFIWDETADKFTLGTTTATGADKSGGITVTAGTLVATCSAAQYSDVAERYHADSNYAPGTIVELGGVNEITSTATEMSEEVFGVVSSNDTAAFMMNDRPNYNDTTHPFIAMTGRVPTNVVGTVTKGARLVSSSTPGYARQAQPGEATAFNVIGRALEAKTDSAMGQVLAVVSIKA